jgi:g-D-glutamyl-meso-diaminopimelate peptidase
MDKIVTVKEYDYYERQRAINSLCEKYKFIKRSIIGKSCGGKDITALKIGSAEEYCLFTAAFHGSERITSLILLMYIEELCETLQSGGYIEGINAKRGLLGRGVIFVPCVNPDGCDISLLGKKACGQSVESIAKLCKNNFEKWNANLRGVDINHNFNADWENLRKKEKSLGIYGPAPTRFGGFKPESEPETIALTNLCRKIKMRHAVALHSQGEVIYWTFGDKRPPRAQKMAEIMATSSGYALDVPVAIADGGGFKDWFISEFNRPGFTIELGLGKNPLPIEQAKDIYRDIREMLVLTTIM